MNDKYTIAIESAIGGGSCALARNGKLVDDFVGTGGVSRAEDLLQDISTLLKRNDLRQTEISSIAVSAGPGSFTGIRIGLATALGFAAGLDIVPDQISMFEAMAISAEITSRITTAVPGGRGMAHVATIEVSDRVIESCGDPRAMPIADLSGLADSETLVIFTGHFDNNALSPSRGLVKYLDRSPAVALIKASTDSRVRKDVEPILISKV